MSAPDEIISLIDAKRGARPVIVGVSGIGGAGKTTFAARLVDALPDAVSVRGDDFLDPLRSHRRSRDWAGVERDRIVDEVIRPARAGDLAATYRPYDWGARALGAPVPVPHAGIYIVEAIGLFHPDTVHEFDVRIWVQCDPALAAERGMARDRAQGSDHDRLWRDIWVPNDADFVRRFNPASTAHHIIVTG